jgi:hypothetical protein
MFSLIFINIFVKTYVIRIVIVVLNFSLKYTDRAQSRSHFASKLSYAKLMLCYGKVA